jgi:hypothetical protein
MKVGRNFDGRRDRMPLNDHEQRILDEIERRLAEDDPNFVEQVGRTDLYSHHTRGIRMAAIAFLLGCVLLLFIGQGIWIALIGFAIMVSSALLIYRYLGQLGRDQVRAMQEEGAFSVTGLIGRLAARFRRS